jgi:hypothetical protein
VKILLAWAFPALTTRPVKFLVFTVLVPFEITKKDHLEMATEGSEEPEERGLSG